MIDRVNVTGVGGLFVWGRGLKCDDLEIIFEIFHRIWQGISIAECIVNQNVPGRVLLVSPVELFPTVTPIKDSNVFVHLTLFSYYFCPFFSFLSRTFLFSFFHRRE